MYNPVLLASRDDRCRSMQIKVELVNIDTLKFHAAQIVIPLRGGRQDAGDGRGGTRFAARVLDAPAAAPAANMYGLGT